MLWESSQSFGERAKLVRTIKIAILTSVSWCLRYHIYAFVVLSIVSQSNIWNGFHLLSLCISIQNNPNSPENFAISYRQHWNNSAYARQKKLRSQNREKYFTCHISVTLKIETNWEGCPLHSSRVTLNQHCFAFICPRTPLVSRYHAISRTQRSHGAVFGCASLFDSWATCVLVGLNKYRASGTDWGKNKV